MDKIMQGGWLAALSGCVVGGLATGAQAVSVTIVEDIRTVEADLTLNGQNQQDTGADTDNDEFKDLAEVLVDNEARVRSNQLSSYRDLENFDQFNIRSRNRVGVETLAGFGAGDTIDGTAMSEFRLAFAIDEAVDFNLFSSGSAPVEGDNDVLGNYIITLTGPGTDIRLAQSPDPAQREIGTLSPGEYLFTVAANVAGNGPARTPVEVDARLVLTDLTPGNGAGGGDGDGDGDGGGNGGEIIPSPAAAGLGAVMLVGGLLRRRS